MRQAQTLNEAQLRRVIQYCRSRRHPVRDETIILVSFYAGLRAKEIAALTVGNVFDEGGRCAPSSCSAQHKARVGKHALCILTSACARLELWAVQYLGDHSAAADLPAKRVGTFSANTMCQLFLDIYKAVGLKDASSHSGRRTYITRLGEQGCRSAPVG